MASARRLRAQLLAQAREDAVDHARVAVDGAGADGVDRRLADQRARGAELDLRQRGGALGQRLHRDLDAREDDPAEVLAGGGDDVVGDRGAEVDDDARPADLVVARDGVDEAVRPDLVRVVVADRHPGAQAGADDLDLGVEVLRAHRGPLRPQLRDRRGDDHPVEHLEVHAAQREQVAHARRRARRRSTRARWRSASAGRARRRGTCRGASGCCRRRRRGAWARHIRLAPPWPRPSTPCPRRIPAPRSRRRSSSRASTTAASTCRRSPTRRSSTPVPRRAPCRGSMLDGEKLLGSRKIVRALDERVPEPPLLPADEKERKSVEIAEEWGDEVLQPLVRRVIWVALRRAPASCRPTARAEAADPGRAGAPDRAAGGARRAAHQQRPPSSTSAPTSPRSTTTSRGSSGGSEHDVIGGEAPNAADLQIGSGLRAAADDRGHRQRSGARPCELARRWFPGYPGHVPAGAFPASGSAGERQRRLGRGGIRPRRDLPTGAAWS